jgi:hypothetical protein
VYARQQTPRALRKAFGEFFPATSERKPFSLFCIRFSFFFLQVGMMFIRKETSKYVIFELLESL